LVPEAVGLKVMSRRQGVAAVALMVLAQLFFWAKSPLTTMLEMVTLTPVTLIRSTDAVCVVCPTVLEPKSRVGGRRITELVTPVPARLIICGLPGASSLMLKEPLSAPADLGQKR